MHTVPICPGCAAGLLVASPGTADISLCPTCRGAWLHAEAARRVLAAAGAPFRYLRRTRVRCPYCRDRMCHEAIAGIDVDRCAAHGLWFDPGELERLASLRDDVVADRNAPIERPVMDALEIVFEVLEGLPDRSD